MNKRPEFRYGPGSENGHWYDCGPPTRCAYQVLGKNGNWRATTIRDAREWGLVPGVTTITRIPASPGLERWKVRNAILAALTHPEAMVEKDADKLIKMIENDSKEQGRKAAEDGTAIHGAIESYFETGVRNLDFKKHIDGVWKALRDLVGDFNREDWNTEYATFHPLGVATRIDLWSERHNMVVDFKSKEFSYNDLDKVSAYPEQAMQLAACREMVLPGARTVNMFISRNEPGLVKSIEWPYEDSIKAWEKFKLLLKYWRISNNFE